jgi:hypothetical protein
MAGYSIVRSPEGSVIQAAYGCPEVSQVLPRHGAGANAEGRDALLHTSSGRPIKFRSYCLVTVQM